MWVCKNYDGDVQSDVVAWAWDVIHWVEQNERRYFNISVCHSVRGYHNLLTGCNKDQI